jgi:hypothetical protein
MFLPRERLGLLVEKLILIQIQVKQVMAQMVAEEELPED